LEGFEQMHLVTTQRALAFLGFVGDSNIIVEIDPALAAGDASHVPDEPMIISQPPLLSSSTF
jgi:hypothetical protein